uniref:Uncharacterized protein n=1 Tax=Anguilla anguilla TaxID=7936 RepID=A0A0E9QEL2_ANGAN
MGKLILFCNPTSSMSQYLIWSKHADITYVVQQ